MLGEFARAGQRPKTIETLSMLSKLPIEAVKSLLRAEAEDGVLILCKAVGLGWSDAKHVLAVMTGASNEDAGNSKRAFDKYYNLTEETAPRNPLRQILQGGVESRSAKNVVIGGIGRAKSRAVSSSG